MDKDKAKPTAAQEQVRQLMLMGGQFKILCLVLDIPSMKPDGSVAEWVEVIDAAKAKGEALALLDVYSVMGDVAKAIRARHG